MNWDNVDWDHFSCVDMARKIKDKIDAEFPTVDALYRHLEETREETFSFLTEMQNKQA